MATILPIVGVIIVIAGFIWYKLRAGASAEADLTAVADKQAAEDKAAADAREREAEARAKEAKEILAIGDPDERRKRAISFLLRQGRSPTSV